MSYDAFVAAESVRQRDTGLPENPLSVSVFGDPRKNVRVHDRPTDDDPDHVFRLESPAKYGDAWPLGDLLAASDGPQTAPVDPGGLVGAASDPRATARRQRPARLDPGDTDDSSRSMTHRQASHLAHMASLSTDDHVTRRRKTGSSRTARTTDDKGGSLRRQTGSSTRSGHDSHGSSEAAAALDSESDKLKREIKRLQHDIKKLSAERRKTVRLNISEMLSSCSSAENSDIDNSTSRTPRSASVCKGEMDGSSQAATILKQPGGKRTEVGGRKDTKPKSPAPSVSNQTNDTHSSGGNSGSNDPPVARRKQLKLEKYDGYSVPLETFLAKYNNCAKFNRWTTEERSVFLRDSLTASASQILWEIKDDATDEEIICLLRNRFGNSNQMEKFRAELHSRRRQRGESLQAVYQDIRKFLALGFPGQFGEMYEILGRDAFLTALNDPNLRIRVLDQAPKTLDEALAVAVRMEAYGTENNATTDDGTKEKRVRMISPARESEADKRVRNLEECVARQKKEIEKLKQSKSRQDNGPRPASDGSAGIQAGTTPYWTPQIVNEPPPPQQLQQQSRPQGPGRAPMRGAPARGNWRSRSRPYNRLRRDVCARCRQPGHWRAECPVPGYQLPQGNDYYVAADTELMNGPQAAMPSNVQMMAGRGRSETYVDLIVKGRTVPALLDSGCEKSVCPLKLCKNAKISGTRMELYAANSAPIKIVGATRLFFDIDGMSCYADVLVSTDVDELILGYDFLEDHNCEWLIGQHRIIINGRSVLLVAQSTFETFCT